MFIYSDEERINVAYRMKEKHDELKALEEEARQIRGRLEYISRQLDAFSSEEEKLKRAFRLNGHDGNYSLATDFEILDIDF